MKKKTKAVVKYYPHRYYIYTFSMAKLLSYGKRDGYTLTIEDEDVIFCFQDLENQYEAKPDSILFYQTRLVLNQEENDIDNIYQTSNSPQGASKAFLDVFVTIDFSDCLNDFDKIKEIRYIKMKVPETQRNDKSRYTIFMKSNSMSKQSRVLYINEDKIGKQGKERTLRDILNERVNFNLLGPKDKFCLPKWYAYSGLSLTDVTFVDDLLITEENSLVIKDFEKTVFPSCVTAVSLASLDKDVNEYFKASGKDKINQFKKLQSIVHSNGWQQLANESKKSGAKDVYEAISTIKTFVDKAESSQNQELVPEDKECWEEKYKELKVDPSSETKTQWFVIQTVEGYRYPHEFNAFDGEGLISYEMADRINRSLKEHGIASADHYSFQFRLPFCKGVLHACNLREFFKDHPEIKSIKGIKLSKDISSQEFEDYTNLEKIDFIFTKSQIKMAKLGYKIANNRADRNGWKGFVALLKKYNHKFGIAGFEPDQDKSARLNLEFLSTLPLTAKNYDYILDGAKKELDDSLTEEKLLKSLQIDEHTFENNDDNSEERESRFIKGNEIDRLIYKANKDFYLASASYKDLHKKQYGSFIKDSLQLKLPIAKSRRLFLSSDLMMLLNYASGLTDKNRLKDNGEPHRYQNGELETRQCYIPNGYSSGIFKEKTEIVLLRNPHYSRNEISILRCAPETDLRKKYFGKLKGVLWCDPYSLTAERLGGADYDGDTIVAISDEKLVHEIFSSIKSKYPVVLIPSPGEDKQHEFKLSNIYECFKNTFSSEIGLISNEALKISEYSYLRDIPQQAGEDDKTYKKRRESIEIERSNHVAFYTILGGLSIDAAKKGNKPSFVPASAFTGENKKTIEDEYITSSFIDFKDTVKGMRFFEDSAVKFTNGTPEADKGPLGLKYKKMASLEDADELWPKYLISRIRTWNYTEPQCKKFEIKSDDSGYDNILLFFKAVCILRIISSYLRSFNELMQECELKKQVIFSAMRKSCPMTENNEDEIRAKTMIDSLSISPSGDRTWTDILKLYCSEKDKPFHWMQKDTEKEEFINSKLNLSDSDINTNGRKEFYDFSNGGFKNLYLAILYKSLEERIKPVAKEFPNSIDDIKKSSDWDWIHKKGVLKNKSFVDNIKTIADEINNEVKKLVDAFEKKYKNRSVKEFKNRVIKKLRNEYTKKAVGLTIPNIQYIMNVQNDKTILDLVPDLLIDYIKGLKPVEKNEK